MKNYIIIALIALMIFAQGVSAQVTPGNGTMTSSSPVIGTISISGVLVADPHVIPAAGKCLDVVKCGVTPNPLCCQGCITGGCVFDENANIVGAATGSYCLKSPLGALPPEVLPCNMTPPPEDDCNSQCEYNAKGTWIGPNLGGYAYDVADGYKTGLRTVNVSVVVSNDDGIHNICDGGLVKMWVDNYDMQNKREIVLVADACNETQTIFRGSFKMHYWEKPGFYTINVEAVTCENTHDIDSKDFEYDSSSTDVCISPPGKVIGYGNFSKNQIVTVNGDVIMSNCTQCDIGSGPATIRNLGNTVINLKVSSSHMWCTGGGCVVGVNKIPVDDLNAIPPVYGVMQINLDNGWHNLNVNLQTENLAKQAYCFETIKHACDGSNMSCKEENVTVYGLPPGPHATNNISLRINGVPNVATGNYAHTITISTAPASTKCCQDHREIAWPEYISCVNVSIPTPMCYELDNNQYYLSSLYRKTCIASPL